MKKLVSILFAFSLTLASNSLLAHAKMVTSIPANNASYDTPLNAIELNFKAPSRLIKLTLKTQGKKVPLDFKPSTQAKSSFKIPLPTLEKGQYQLEWITLGSDGHKMKSKVNFNQAK